MKPFAAAPLEQVIDSSIIAFLAPDDVLRMPFILDNRLGCILTTLRQEPQNLEIMVNACITLHGGRRGQMMLDAKVGIRYSPHL